MRILMVLIRFNESGYIYDKDSTKRLCNYLLPLGLSYISAVLKKEGFNVDCLNLNHHDGHVRDVIARGMKRHRYDVVFLGGLSLYYPHIRDTIQYIQQASPKTKIIVGGGIITSQPELMYDLLGADYGVIGEGENTAVELTRCLERNSNPTDVSGIIFRDKYGNLIITSPREQIMDLDSLPYPDYDGFGYAEYLGRVKPADYIAYDVVDEPRFYPILTARSCPFKCTFCFHPLGNKYRQRSIDNIMGEIKYAVTKYRINIVFMYDELFSHDKKRVFEFCDKFKAFSDTLPYKLWFYTSMRVDSTDNEMLEKMKDSGAYLLSFGLESYSQTVLDSMKKHTTPEQINKIFHLIRDNNLGIQGSFIFGDVAETCETAKETLDYFTHDPTLIRGGVQVGFIVPFQGSPIYQHCVKNGKVKDEVKFIQDRQIEGYNYNEPMNLTDAMTDDQFEELKDKAFGAHLSAWKFSIPKDDGEGGVIVKCPFCGETSHIKNMLKPKWRKLQNVGCRHCYARFVMTSGWYPLERFLIRTVGFNRIYWLKKKLGV